MAELSAAVVQVHSQQAGRLCEALLSRGYRVIACGQPEGLERFAPPGAQRISAAPDDPGGVAALVEHLSGGSLDLLVTMPGETRQLEEPQEINDATVGEAHSEALTLTMNESAHLPVHVSHKVAHLMSESGQMIHVAPAGGPVGVSGGGGPALRMAKSALLAGSKALRATAPFTVRAVCPAELGDIDLETILWLVSDNASAGHAFAAKANVDG